MKRLLKTALAVAATGGGLLTSSSTFAAGSAPEGTPSCPTQNFDGVAAPGLPAGWTSTTPVGAGVFTTVTGTGQFDSSPNSAWADNLAAVNDVRLDSPSFTPGPGTVLNFKHRRNLESGFDGAVLEISVNSGAFQDIVAAGGVFFSNGYNGTISSAYDNPIGGRQAWTGSSSGAFVTTSVQLPAAASGQPTQVRFRTADDNGFAATAPKGWWIDTITCSAAPPSVAKAFAPTNTPVGTPSTLTISLASPSGIATLTSDLVDTLPAGLVVASTPNASTTCTSGIVAAPAGSGTVALQSGAKIPVAGCTVSVNVSAAAPGIFPNTIAAGALVTDLGNSPSAASAVYQATQAGAVTYNTGFESPTFTAGQLGTQGGWGRTSGSAAADLTIATVNPGAGSQHLRIQSSATSTNADTAISPTQPVGTTTYAIASAKLFISQNGATSGTEMDFSPQDPAASSITTRVRFLRPTAGVNKIQVLDPNGGGPGVSGFVDTTGVWPADTYFNLKVISNRAAQTSEICINGVSVGSVAGFARNIANLAISNNRATAATVGNRLDVDDVVIDYSNVGTCNGLPPSHTVTPVVGAGSGSISPNVPVTVADGATTSFDLSPALGSHIDTVTGCGGSMTDADTYTTGPITMDCTVTANFAADPVGGLSLTVGLTPGGNGSTCGVATSAAVNVGDTVDFCYTVTNNSATAMAYSTLDDSVSGNIFTNTPTTIAANGGTYVYHRSVTASTSATFGETWTSRNLLPGYTYNDTGTSAFADISGTGTALGYASDSSDDEIKGVTMPFAFSFYGASSDKLCVSNNGLIFFGVSDPCPTGGSTIPWFGNVALPTANLPNPAILPFWDDFGNGPGDVYYATQGVAPARKFIVQWNNIQHYSSTPQRATFEVVLDEATGNVSFEYLATLFGNPSYDNGISATVGLQSGPTVANQYSFNTASLSAGKSIVWTSGAATVLTANASVSLDVGAPVIGVTPTALAGTALSGSTTPVVQNLSIANTGDRALTWSITEAAADHAPQPVTSVTPPVVASGAMAMSPHRAERVEQNRIPVITGGALKALVEQREIAAREGHPVEADVSDAGLAVSHNVLPAGSSCGPSVQGIIIHDDNTVENGYSGNNSTISSFVAVDKFTPSAYPATFTSVCTAFVTNTGATSLSYEVVVFDDSGAGGSPGVELGAVSATSSTIATGVGAPLFNSVDISALNLNIVSGSVYIGVRFNPMAMPGRFISSDQNGPTNAGGYVSFDSGSGPAFAPTVNSWASYRSLMVRAVEGVSGCVLPEDVSWLSVGPTSGTVQAGDPAAVTIVTMNPTGLADGLYTANVCVASNDMAHPMTAVPVSFTVGDVDPAAVVNPTSLAFTVEEGNTDSGAFSITNSGDPGSVLNFAITEAVGSCATPANAPWLSVSPTSGNVPVGTPASVVVAVDSGALAVGSYSAILCLATNDPAQATIPVAISFTVTLPDLIFADGFDPASPLITGTINQPAVADGNGSSFDFVTGSFHGYDSGITADDINLYTNSAPSINVYWYGDAVPDEFQDFVGGVVATDGQADFRVLHSGDVVGAASPVSAASQGADMSAFEAGVNGYIGVAFYNESTDAVNYGYLHVQTSSGGFPIQVLDYGYDPTGADVTIP